MAKTLLDHRGDVLKYLQDDGDSVVEVMEQDLDPLLRHAKVMRETHVQDREMKLAGYIPGFVVERMMRDGSFHDPQAIKRWLNDPQNKDFRVWEGRL